VALDIYNKDVIRFPSIWVLVYGVHPSPKQGCRSIGSTPPFFVLLGGSRLTSANNSHWYILPAYRLFCPSYHRGFRFTAKTVPHHLPDRRPEGRARDYSKPEACPDLYQQCGQHLHVSVHSRGDLQHNEMLVQTAEIFIGHLGCYSTASTLSVRLHCHSSTLADLPTWSREVLVPGTFLPRKHDYHNVFL
jgi:hypothetical protein